MANNVYAANDLTGGTAGCLDDIDHSILATGDVAVTVDYANAVIYFHYYDSTDATAESSPDVIKPDSNSGNGRWLIGSWSTLDIGSTSSEIRHTYHRDEGYSYYGTDQDSFVGHQGSYFIVSCDWGGIYLKTTISTAIYLQTNGTTRWTVAGADGHLLPNANDTYNIGADATRVSTIYTVNAVDVSSDKNLKTEIKQSDLGLEFITKLNPVSYKYNFVKDDDTRYGLIAQEVEEALKDSGKTLKDFKGVTFHKQSGKYSIGYTEFIGPMIKAIQELKEELDKLKKDK